ncbi:MAG: hypothetical protein R6V58_06225 [Planctomycetota bacterium]
MGHRSYTSGKPSKRGNRRTRRGAGRHNTKNVGLNGPKAAIRICLGCDRPFRSRGPWNRFCHRCHQAHAGEEEPQTYRVPHEYRDILLGPDDF